MLCLFTVRWQGNNPKTVAKGKLAAKAFTVKHVEDRRAWAKIQKPEVTTHTSSRPGIPDPSTQIKSEHSKTRKLELNI